MLFASLYIAYQVKVLALIIDRCLCKSLSMYYLYFRIQYIYSVIISEEFVCISISKFRFVGQQMMTRVC